MLILSRKDVVYPAVLALLIFSSSCSTPTEGPSSMPSSANLIPLQEGPESPPELTINGTQLAAVSYNWTGSNGVDVFEDSPSIEDIETVSLDPSRPVLLNVRLNTSVPPYYSLIRQCSRLDANGYPDLSSCSYTECVGEEQCFRSVESQIESDTELLSETKFVTITIQYPNDSGWDAEAVENPDNYANYSFFLEQD